MSKQDRTAGEACAVGLDNPRITPVTVRPGVYLTTTPCEHTTIVRVVIALYANRRGPQGAQCRACNRRWRLCITDDPQRGLEALWWTRDP